MRNHLILIAATWAASLSGGACGGEVNDNVLRRQALATLREAAAFYHDRVSSHGGYVYYYSCGLGERWGEGKATRDQVWVQPPGTPTVGMAYLRAFEATGDRFYLGAAQRAAEALIYGQLESGGWTNLVDFNPAGRVALYRNGKGGGKNNSSLDDGQTQSALRFLIHMDQALSFRNRSVHEAARYAVDAISPSVDGTGGGSAGTQSKLPRV